MRHTKHAGDFILYYEWDGGTQIVRIWHRRQAGQVTVPRKAWAAVMKQTRSAELTAAHFLEISQ